MDEEGKDLMKDLLQKLTNYAKGEKFYISEDGSDAITDTGILKFRRFFNFFEEIIRLFPFASDEMYLLYCNYAESAHSLETKAGLGLARKESMKMVKEYNERCESMRKEFDEMFMRNGVLDLELLERFRTENTGEDYSSYSLLFLMVEDTLIFDGLEQTKSKMSIFDQWIKGTPWYHSTRVSNFRRSLQNVGIKRPPRNLKRQPRRTVKRRR